MGQRQRQAVGRALQARRRRGAGERRGEPRTKRGKTGVAGAGVGVGCVGAALRRRGWCGGVQAAPGEGSHRNEGEGDSDSDHIAVDEPRLTEIVSPGATIVLGDGTVTLGVSGVPASWTADIAGGNTANLISNLTTTKTVTLTIPSNAAPAQGGVQITVQATGASGTHSASRSVTVANEFIVVMPNGTGGGVHWGAVVGTTVQLKVGTAFRFRNDDGTTHQIHFDGDIPGFVHQPDPGAAQGQSYVVTSTGPGTEDDVHCHIHGTGVGTFTVVVSN